MRNIGLLLESMIAAVMSEHHLPLDEVRTWNWKRLFATFKVVGKTQYERWVSEIQKQQIATSRGIVAVFGKGNELDDLPEYAEISDDPWTPVPAPKILNPLMAAIRVPTKEEIEGHE